jgi:hypothetical protein
MGLCKVKAVAATMSVLGFDIYRQIKGGVIVTLHLEFIHCLMEHKIIKSVPFGDWPHVSTRIKKQVVKLTALSSGATTENHSTSRRKLFCDATLDEIPQQ